MEWLGPAIELVKTGSPYVSGGMAVALLAGVYFREVRRHYAAELQAWSDRYAELQDRCSNLEARYDKAVEAWWKVEREMSEVIRKGREAVREVGGP